MVTDCPKGLKQLSTWLSSALWSAAKRIVWRNHDTDLHVYVFNNSCCSLSHCGDRCQWNQWQPIMLIPHIIMWELIPWRHWAFGTRLSVPTWGWQEKADTETCVQHIPVRKCTSDRAAPRRIRTAPRAQSLGQGRAATVGARLETPNTKDE